MKPTTSMEEIDAVYLWVSPEEGGKAVEIAKQESSKEQPVDAEGLLFRRFRDRDELRFSLRSICDNAPWIRKIHIVTDSQTPKWLDLSHPKIHLVRHEEIFLNPSVLPSFNSYAIESAISRVPGLANYFLYFNDDFFLGRKLTPESLFPEGLPVLLRQNSLIEKVEYETSSIPHKVGTRTMRLVEKKLSRAIGPQYQAMHAPYFWNLKSLHEILDVFKEQVVTTQKNRFRSSDDIGLPDLYVLYNSIFNATSFKEVIYELGSKDFYFICLNDSKFYCGLKDLWGAFCNRPNFICINDDTCHLGSLKDKILSFAMGRLLKFFFPRPAPWEKIN